MVDQCCPVSFPSLFFAYAVYSLSIIMGVCEAHMLASSETNFKELKVDLVIEMVAHHKLKWVADVPLCNVSF